MGSRKAEETTYGQIRAIPREIEHHRQANGPAPRTASLLWSRAVIGLAQLCLALVPSATGWAAAGADGFDFNDGTTQGWTSDGPTIPPSDITLDSNLTFSWSDVSDYPGDPGTSAIGDDLGSLQIHTPGGHGIEGPNSVNDYWAVDFASPDLSFSQTWQRAAGFTVRIANCMGGSEVQVYANLHLFFRDPVTGNTRHFVNGPAVPLASGVWSLQTFDWYEEGEPLPTSYTVEQIKIGLWGPMASGEELEGAVYVDDVFPFMPPATYYVDDEGGGPAEDGSSEHPFDTIQEAVDVALDEDTVLVRDGLYQGPGNWNIDFAGKSILVQSANGPAECRVQGTMPQDQSLPGFHFHTGETDAAVLKGFTIARSNGGPAILCTGSSPSIINCIVRDNHAAEGAGLYCEDSNANIRNCVFFENIADRGAAIFAAQSNLVVANCTFTDNSADQEGGGVHLAGTELAMTNCILWSNTAPLGAELSLADASTATISYCALGAGTAEDCSCDAGSTLNRSVGNMAIDPLLADDNYHLQSDSPCIDVGEPAGAYWELLDIDDTPRLFNARVDMGADEFSPKIRNLTQGTYADTIREAVDQAVDGDTIEVPSGIYSGQGNHIIEFGGKGITLRSADGPAQCIIDCHGRREGVSDPIGFKFVHEEGPDSVLDGFTIRNGFGIFGGAVLILQSSPTIRNCRFVYNRAGDQGGAVACGTDSNPAFVNCLFLNNEAKNGGGLSIDGGNVTITNCTFLHNLSREGGIGGALHCSTGTTQIHNCVFWNNVVVYEACNQIAMENLSNQPTKLIITHSNVMGGREDIHIDSECTLDWGAGNIDVDPLLTPDGHLRSGSPCIGAGAMPGAPASDWEGEARSSDALADMGCDEYVDSDLDELPDYWEQRFFASPTEALASEDADGDTFSNLVECTLFGSNPVNPPYFVDGDTGSDDYDGLAAQYETGSRGPKKTIQSGINTAGDGDTVLVAPGTYRGAGNVNLLTWGKPIVVHAPEGPSSTIIDCEEAARGFGFWWYETRATVVSGFTVTRGKTEYRGGAMVCGWASPRIRNCVLTDNEAAWGGGLFAWVAGLVLENCRIEGNRPNGLELGWGGLHLEGTTHLAGNGWIGNKVMFTGPGTLELQPEVWAVVVDSRVRCNLQGPGSLQVYLGYDLTVEGDAVLDLGGADANGEIQCDGLLRVREQAQIRNAEIAISRARFEGDVDISNSVITAEAGVPYGQFFIEDSVTIADNEIHADGDRYMDLDPSVFAGVIANNCIYVTITEGQHSTRGGLLELRGNDTVCTTGTDCEPGAFQLPSVPGFDTTTWTIERLELWPGAQVNLTNRFDFGNGDLHEVMYAKELVLGENSILNTAYNRFYYERLEDYGGAIVNLPLLGFSLNVVRFDDENEFAVRVVHNTFLHSQTEAYNRIHVARVLEAPDPAGMMRMRNLKDLDPLSLTYGQVIQARAKALFAKSNEDEILITFDYLFETDDPNTELAIYLSDAPALQSPRDPAYYLDVERLRPPQRGRPGAVGSGRFGTFHRYVPRAHLDFIRGTRVEFELIGPDGASILINDWDPRIVCPNDICLNFVQNALVEPLDLLPVIAACGRAAGLEQDGDASECLDGALSCDGYLDTGDMLSFEWAQRAWFAGAGGSVCPDQSSNGGGLPLADNRSGVRPSAGYAPAAGGSASAGGALFIIAKPQWQSKETEGINIVSECLYSLDDSGHHVQTTALAHGWCNAGVACDPEGRMYQVTLDGGLLRLHDDGSSSPVIAPSRMPYDKADPRYGGSADICVGIQDDGGQFYGRPIWDVAFDAESVYVVPVAVVPNSASHAPYLAAAKLTITGEGGLGYRVAELYDDPDALDSTLDNPCFGGLREIEVDADGNVYLLNAYNRNESDLLWKYAPDGSVLRLCLNGINNAAGIPDPTGLCVSDSAGMIYLVSGQSDPSHPQATTVYGFATEDLTLKRRITVENMPLATDLAEDPATGALWVVGFDLEESELDVKDWDDVGESFYQPCLARISSDGAVESIDISGDHDLALPLSILWRPDVDD